jgi:hypothetical protein
MTAKELIVKLLNVENINGEVLLNQFDSKLVSGNTARNDIMNIKDDGDIIWLRNFK